MADLTTRFLGLGVDRLMHTIELSNGLATPASKSKIRVPDLKPFFPPGRWTEGKTPRVSKNKVGSISNASIGEAVFTDTFESGDSRFRYCQAYFDMASHWGDMFPMRSRNDVGPVVRRLLQQELGSLGPRPGQHRGAYRRFLDGGMHEAECAECLHLSQASSAELR